jgi:hypothetical protein
VAGANFQNLGVPVDMLFERIQRRDMENPPIRREQLLQWAEIFQAPTTGEAALFDHALTVES